jgi:predicted RNase H-like nuclease
VTRRGGARAGATPTRFLGVDLAWGHGNASGVVALAGHAFPLRLSSDADVVPDHAAAFDWIAAQADGGPTAVGIDAPLLGLGASRRRRPCDNLVSSAFGRFHASTHSPPRAPDLRRFADRLRRRYGARSLVPSVLPTSVRPAIREVYPNALQVLLFELERRQSAIMPYKRRRFGQKRAWVTRGLRPFIARCRRVLEAEYVDRHAPGWRALVALTPRATMAHGELKAIEDRWDAVLCALAVALEHLAPDTMRAYAGAGSAGWRRGYILAPVLPIRRGARRAIDPRGHPA